MVFRDMIISWLLRCALISSIYPLRSWGLSLESIRVGAASPTSVEGPYVVRLRLVPCVERDSFTDVERELPVSPGISWYGVYSPPPFP